MLHNYWCSIVRSTWYIDFSRNLKTSFQIACHSTEMSNDIWWNCNGLFEYNEQVDGIRRALNGCQKNEVDRRYPRAEFNDHMCSRRYLVYSRELFYCQRDKYNGLNQRKGGRDRESARNFTRKLEAIRPELTSSLPTRDFEPLSFSFSPSLFIDLVARRTFIFTYVCKRMHL